MGAAVIKLFRVFRQKDVRIMMLGLDNAGKTTILYRWKLGKLISSTPTVGFNVETVVCHRSAMLESPLMPQSSSLCGTSVDKKTCGLCDGIITQVSIDCWHSSLRRDGGHHLRR